MHYQNKSFSRRLALHLLFVASIAPTLQAEDWPEFLGPGGNPVKPATNLPDTFKVASDDSAALNIAWRTPLPGRSVSGPIVVAGKVITTSSSSTEERWLNIAAVDELDGNVLWQRSVKATGRPYSHPTSANAAPTPCSDGQQVYAFFSSNDLVCYDLKGNLQWFRSFTDEHPLAGNDVGMSSSPIAVDGIVVVMIECQADSFCAGLDARTGETKWEVPRPPEANWSSPRVGIGKDGIPVVVVHGQRDLMGINPATGEVAWEIDERCSSVATSLFADGQLYVPSGGVKVFTLEEGLKAPTLDWETSRINPNSASLMVTSLGVIGLNRSVLVCCEPGGDLRWQARLPDAGQFWATPVIAGDTMYAFAMDGTCFIVKLSEEGAEVVEKCQLGEEVLGSPAIGNEALFVRSVDALWKIAK